MKPVVILIYMQGCGACEEAKPEFEKFARKYSDRLQFALMDIDKATVPFPVPYTPAVALRVPGGVYRTDAVQLDGVTLDSLERWCSNALADYRQRRG